MGPNSRCARLGRRGRPLKRVRVSAECEIGEGHELLDASRMATALASLSLGLDTPLRYAPLRNVCPDLLK